VASKAIDMAISITANNSKQDRHEAESSFVMPSRTANALPTKAQRVDMACNREVPSPLLLAQVGGEEDDGDEKGI